MDFARGTTLGYRDLASDSAVGGMLLPLFLWDVMGWRGELSMSAAWLSMRCLIELGLGFERGGVVFAVY